MSSQQQRLLYVTVGLVIGTALGYYLSQPRKKRKKKRELFPKKTDSDLERESAAFAAFAEGGGPPQKNIAAFDNRVGFLTGLVSQLWEYINPAASVKIRNMLKKYFKVIKIDLGSAPLLLDHVTVHEIDRDDGFVQFDMDVLWDGECEMLFNLAKVGRFGIKALKLKGRMSMLLKPLTSEWMPCICAFSYAFINQPELDLTFTGLASVAEFSYIDRNVRKILNDALASMVVLPNRLIYRMDENASLMEIYQPPHGIARLTLESGHGFNLELKSFGPDDIPDVYCNISFADSTVRTPTVKNSLKPTWNHSMDFMVFDLDQSFALDAWDEDSNPLDPDDGLGITHVTVREMLLSKDRRMQLKLFDKESGSPTGAFLNVKCDLIPLLSVQSAKIPKNLPEGELFGVMVILVRQAFDIPFKVEEAATMVKVKAGEEAFVTSVVKDAPGYDAINPLYDCVFHVPIAAEKPDVTFVLIQAKDTVIGTHTVTFDEVLKTPTIHKESQEMGTKGAKLEFSVRLLTVEGTDTSTPIPSRSNSPPRGLRATFSAINRSANLSQSHSTDTEPESPEAVEMRKIRVTAVKGKGFKVRRKFLQMHEVPDVYLKIRFGDHSPWQTSIIPNNTAPSWDESKVYTFVSNSEVFHVEAWDHNSGRLAGPLGRDDLYGAASVSINKILLDGGTTDLEMESHGKKLGLYITLNVSLLD